MLRLWQLFIALTALSLPITNAHAQDWEHDFDTGIAVTVLAKDAKFIGDAMGGARVIITDKLTGDIMIDGHTYGTTGNTETIMTESRERHVTLSDQNSARFEFSLAILEPTAVTITAIAPLAQMQSAVKVSQDYVLIPGKDYTSGDGIMLELPGMAVDIQAPTPHEKAKFDADVPITVAASVMKACGCHVATDSPWDPENYDVEAHVYKGTEFISALPMQYSGAPGQYMSRIKIPLPGSYKIIVTAFDKKTKEGGMDAATIVLTE
jgi:hypothetical protein